MFQDEEIIRMKVERIDTLMKIRIPNLVEHKQKITIKKQQKKITKFQT